MRHTSAALQPRQAPSIWLRSGRWRGLGRLPFSWTVQGSTSSRRSCWFMSAACKVSQEAAGGRGEAGNGGGMGLMHKVSEDLELGHLWLYGLLIFDLKCEKKIKKGKKGQEQALSLKSTCLIISFSFLFVHHLSIRPSIHPSIHQAFPMHTCSHPPLLRHTLSFIHLPT